MGARTTIAITFMGVFLLGCATVAEESNLIDTCQQVLYPQRIWVGQPDQYVGRFILSSAEKVFVGGKERIHGEVGAGTKVKVSQVIRNLDLGYGPFLRVEVEVLEGPFAGLIADIPACVPYHPYPRWVDTCTLDPNALQFNPDLVRACGN